MPSIMSTGPVEEGYFEETLLPDVFTGILAWVVIIPLALALGGFMFLEPWGIVIPPVTFSFGMVRGKSHGNAWLKGIAMNLVILLLLICRAAGEPFDSTGVATVLTVIVLTVVPTAGGIALRRRLLARTRPKK
jgi:hypothetical protein